MRTHVRVCVCACVQAERVTCSRHALSALIDSSAARHFVLCDCLVMLQRLAQAAPCRHAYPTGRIDSATLPSSTLHATRPEDGTLRNFRRVINVSRVYCSARCPAAQRTNVEACINGTDWHRP
jgi:hypothetical protein